MRVFVTGASGHIGSIVVRELLDHGHQVVGLARSDDSAAAISAAGAEVQRGSLDDLDVLSAAAAAADGVIHLAFVHDFSDYAAAGAIDLRAVEAMGEALADSGKPFVNTSGTMMLAFAGTGRLGSEDDVADDSGPRAASENATIALAERGVRSSVVRLSPTVHGSTDFHGFVPTLIDAARKTGQSVYVGGGANRWPAVHTIDAARLYRLAVESAPAGSRLHGAAEEGVPFRDIANRHRGATRRARGRHHGRGSRRAARLHRSDRRAGQPDLQCSDPGAVGLAARAARPARRSQGGALLRDRLVTNDVVTVARETLGSVGAYLPFGFTSAPPADLQRSVVRRLESAGFRTAWSNEVVGGKDALVQLAVLLAATEGMAFGTGIANIWARQPQTMHAAAAFLAQAYPNRLVLGLGVGFPEQAASTGQEFGRPLSTMRDYLRRMNEQTWPPAADVGYPRIVGAMGPKLLALGGEHADGAMPPGCLRRSPLRPGRRWARTSFWRSG